MDWLGIASSLPPTGATTFEDLEQYATAFNGYDYVGEVLKVDAFQHYDSLKNGGLEEASVEDVRFFLFMLQREIRWTEGGAIETAGRESFMRTVDLLRRRLG